MASNTYGAIKLSTAEDVGAVLKKKTGSQDGYKPKEWADTINLLGLLPVRTASGSIAHFTDGADDVPLKSLTAQILPIQSGTGTPSPSNPRPISGTDELTLTKTGANIFSIIPKLEELHIEYSVDNDGWITLPSISQASSALYTSHSKIPLLNNGSALFLIDAERTTATNVRLRLYKDGTAVTETPSGNNPVNRRENFSFNEVGLNWSQQGSATFKIVIVNAPTIETTYEPYNAETYTFDLGQEIMGGSADVVGGVGSKTMAEIDLGNLTWNAYAWGFQSTEIPTGINPPTTDNDITTAICEQYSPASANAVFASVSDSIFGIRGGNGRVVIHDSTKSGMTASEFQTAMAGIKLAYPLATPTDFTFTGQPINSLLGVNNVWTDSGEVLDVEYRADMNLLIAELGG